MALTSLFEIKCYTIGVAPITQLLTFMILPIFEQIRAIGPSIKRCSNDYNQPVWK